MTTRVPTLAAVTVVPSGILADSDPGRQRFSQASILVRSAVIALSQRPSLLATIALLETHALVLRHCLHLALFHRSSLLSNSLVYLIVQWVKIFVG